MAEAAMHRLREQLRSEMAQVDRIVHDLDEVSLRLHATPDDRIVLEAASVRLHGFYSGIERCLASIARTFEGLPTSDEWHRELVDRLSRDIPGQRHAVLSSESVRSLHRFRTFRHRFRNLYSFQLDVEQVTPILEAAAAAWQRVSDEMRAFLGGFSPKAQD